MGKAQADLHGDRAHNDCDAGMDQTMVSTTNSTAPSVRRDGAIQPRQALRAARNIGTAVEGSTAKDATSIKASCRLASRSTVSPWELPQDDVHVDARHALLDTVLAAMSRR